MKDKPLKTYYASAERAGSDILIKQRDQLISNELLVNISNSVSQMLLVLNRHRQIVYANKPFCDFLGISDPQSIIGKRPGEAVKCKYSYECQAGCGTSEFCKTCGAVNAILESESGIQSEKECQILTKENMALDLKVLATPFETENETLTIFAVNDISHEKRKNILEKVFYHDVLNSAGSISGLSSILKELEDPDEKAEIAALISRACDNLVNEIQSQKQLVSAEQGELEINLSPFASVEILQELAELYSKHEVIGDKYIVIDKTSQNFIVKTDLSLLRRIIGNMIKNALEAESGKSQVVLKCQQNGVGNRFSVHNQTFIPREIQLQLFKRSFTTKGVGRGIGTYSMKLLGEKYLNGKVGFESTPEEGTTFYIDL